MIPPEMTMKDTFLARLKQQYELEEKNMRLKVSQRVKKVSQRVKKVSDKVNQRVQKVSDKVKKVSDKLDTYISHRVHKIKSHRVFRIISSWNEQVSFTVGVLNAFLFCFCMGGLRPLVPIIFAVEIPLLMIARYFMYKKHKWQWYMIDFCYWGNLGLFLYITLFPHNAQAFVILYGMTQGPMLWALIVFRNSLVFHSLDKATSVFIHLAPALVTFVLKWHSNEMPNYAVCTTDDCSSDFTTTVLLPTGYFILHQIMYWVFIQCILRKWFEEDKDLQTLYRYVVSKKNTLFCKGVTYFGRRWRVLMYGLINIAFTFVITIPAYFTFHYYYLNVLVILFAFVCSVWNGATYYFAVVLNVPTPAPTSTPVQKVSKSLSKASQAQKKNQ
eukprot:GILI01020365.1.p1 GENE.GILI01020365.1~~GILI01020365.1.p1  ORF type:complete len:408 (+),score=76.36 GILI01020365.1:72-1226(+)